MEVDKTLPLFRHFTLEKVEKGYFILGRKNRKFTFPLIFLIHYQMLSKFVILSDSLIFQFQSKGMDICYQMYSFSLGKCVMFCLSPATTILFIASGKLYLFQEKKFIQWGDYRYLSSFLKRIDHFLPFLHEHINLQSFFEVCAIQAKIHPMNLLQLQQLQNFSIPPEKKFKIKYNNDNLYSFCSQNDFTSLSSLPERVWKTIQEGEKTLELPIYSVFFDKLPSIFTCTSLEEVKKCLLELEEDEGKVVHDYLLNL